MRINTSNLLYATGMENNRSQSLRTPIPITNVSEQYRQKYYKRYLLTIIYMAKSYNVSIRKIIRLTKFSKLNVYLGLCHCVANFEKTLRK